jgi:hypothetical protein
MFELPCDFSRVFARIAELHLVVMEQGGHKLYVVSFAPEKEGVISTCLGYLKPAHIYNRY